MEYLLTHAGTQYSCRAPHYEQVKRLLFGGPGRHASAEARSLKATGTSCRFLFFSSAGKLCKDLIKGKCSDKTWIASACLKKKEDKYPAVMQLVYPQLAVRYWLCGSGKSQRERERVDTKEATSSKEAGWKLNVLCFFWSKRDIIKERCKIHGPDADLLHHHETEYNTRCASTRFTEMKV